MMLQNRLNIVIVDVILLAKWWPVKILTVKENGSILFAWSRKIYLRNGIVQTVKDKETKQRIPILEDTL